MEAGRRGFFGVGWGVGGVLCVGRLSEVNDKAHFCVGELELSHRQRALHRSASAHKQCQRSINMTMSGGWEELWWVCLTLSLGPSALLRLKWSFERLCTLKS